MRGRENPDSFPFSEAALLLSCVLDLGANELQVFVDLFVLAKLIHSV